MTATRLREEFEHGVGSHEAARISIGEGTWAVTAAGVILAGTFASLLLTGIQLPEEIGTAVALGVLRVQRAGHPDCADARRRAGLPLLLAPSHAHQDGGRPGGVGGAPAECRHGLGRQ